MESQGQKVSAVIFDLDGTLLNTLEDLADAVNAALRENGMPERTTEEVCRFVGNGIRRLMERAVPGGESNPGFEKAFSDFQSYYGVHCMGKTDAYPGIRELLAELKARGVRMAIVSNKMDLAVRALNRKYFSGYITTAIGETSQILRKPAPDTVLAALRELGVDKKNAIYVGDSDVDIATAANAGMRCVSVTWGFRGRDFLLEHGAGTLIDTPEELLNFL